MSLLSIIQHPHFHLFISTTLIAKVVLVYFLIYFFSNTPREPFPEELEYTTIDSKVGSKRHPLPTTEEDDIELSVVVPSYNETSRILIMLQDAIEYLQSNMKNRWEIIIVDDGSSDETSEYCLKLSREEFNLQPGQLRVIKFTQNRGKGGAVRQGMLHIRGKYGLFADADGASKFSDVSKLISTIKEMEKNDKDAKKKQPAVALGSRAYMVNTEAVIKRSLLRNILMYGFHALVYVFGIRSIDDTQCGFKLFNRESIDLIFPFLHTEGWIFDVEILILAIKKHIPIKEIPISWHEVGGSKMDLKIDSLMMAKDLVIIRLAYMLGIYKPNRRFS
ncbi:dolichyl-phosphate beta-glucosyltransferase [Monosporozyma servazzii]